MAQEVYGRNLGSTFLVERIHNVGRNGNSAWTEGGDLDALFQDSMVCAHAPFPHSSTRGDGDAWSKG